MRLAGEEPITQDPVRAAELLRLYTAADTEPEARVLLDTLFVENVQPWCAESARRALNSYGLRHTDRADQLQEIEADVLLHMAIRFQAMRRDPELCIDNLRAYIATCARHACLARLRARSPLHVRLQNRIRYLLRNDTRFALWTDSAGEQLTGVAEWNGRNDVQPAPELQRSSGPVDGTLMTAFAVAGGPLRLADLIGMAAAAAGITEPIDVGLSEGFDLPSQTSAADSTLAERESLRRLWREVILLPPAQRAALLFNLRDSGGNGVIELLPATGTATLAEIAAALSMAQEQLAQIWNDLPLDDLRISGMMKISRQQVINLRKSARERLARRIAQSNNTAGSTSITSRTLKARLESLWRRRQGPS